MRVKIALVALIILLMSQAVFAYELPMKVKLNNDYFHTDTELETVEGRVFIPLRPFAEAFGAKLEWLEVDQVAHVTKDDLDLVIGPGVGKSIRVDAEIPLETDAFFKDSVLYVALKPFVEIFGATVTWDESKQTIFIVSKDAKLPAEFIEEAKEVKPIKTYTDADVLLLAQLIFVETRGGSLERSLGVANVVLNRVKSNRYPNTLHGVVYQPGQFPPTRNGSFKSSKPDAICMQAAAMAFEGVNNVGASLYFNNRPFSWKAKSDLFKVIQGMYFYK